MATFNRETGRVTLTEVEKIRASYVATYNLQNIRFAELLYPLFIKAAEDGVTAQECMDALNNVFGLIHMQSEWAKLKEEGGDWVIFAAILCIPSDDPVLIEINGGPLPQRQEEEKEEGGSDDGYSDEAEKALEQLIEDIKKPKTKRGKADKTSLKVTKEEKVDAA